ncbi:hypothetical protein NCS56_01509900 [Fusarium sp. Ph1]|nr:hypothetical protein NCS56_01509900 [Fusarium sp. Ph1]
MAPRKKQMEPRDNDLNTVPRDSPYTGPMVKIRFEDGDQANLAMHVHESLLRPFPALSPVCGSLGGTAELRIKDVSQNAGHVLVHFLYTGKYQTLRVDIWPPEERLVAQFRTCLQVYVASRTYRLRNLQSLAQIELEQLGQKVAVPDLITVAEEIYPRTHLEDLWFPSFIHSCLSRMPDDLELPMAQKLLRQLETKNTIGSLVLRSFMLRSQRSNMTADGSSVPRDLARKQQHPFRADKAESTTNKPEPPNPGVSNNANYTPSTTSLEDLGSV